MTWGQRHPAGPTPGNTTKRIFPCKLPHQGNARNPKLNKTQDGKIILPFFLPLVFIKLLRRKNKDVIRNIPPHVMADMASQNPWGDDNTLQSFYRWGTESRKQQYSSGHPVGDDPPPLYIFVKGHNKSILHMQMMLVHVFICATKKYGQE